MLNEADTCTRYIVPKLREAGWDTEPHSFDVNMKKKTAKAMPRERRKTSRRRTPAGHLPKGWTQKRADEIARYYDNQSDEEAIAEMEAAYKDGSFAMMAIPRALVPEVTRLIAKRAG